MNIVSVDYGKYVTREMPQAAKNQLVIKNHASCPMEYFGEGEHFPL